MTCFFLKALFRFLVFFVNIWLAWDFENIYFPVPVFLNLFAAALFVLIFGIFSSLSNYENMASDVLMVFMAYCSLEYIRAGRSADRIFIP